MDLLEIIYKLVLMGLYCSCANSNLDIRKISMNISEEIIEMKNNELGVPFIENLYKNFNFFPWNSNVANKVDYITHDMETIIANIFAIMESAKIVSDIQCRRRNILNISSVTPCSQKLSKLFINASSEELFESSYLTYDVLEKIEESMSSVSPFVKRVFLISNAEIEQAHQTPFLHCISHDEVLIWEQYMARNIYERRNIILVLDVGGSTNQAQFQIIKSIGKHDYWMNRDVSLHLLFLNANYPDEVENHLNDDLEIMIKWSMRTC